MPWFNRSKTLAYCHLKVVDGFGLKRGLRVNFLRDFLAITLGVVVGGWLLYFSVQAYEDHRSSKDQIMMQPEKLNSE